MKCDNVMLQLLWLIIIELNTLLHATMFSNYPYSDTCMCMGLVCTGCGYTKYIIDESKFFEGGPAFNLSPGYMRMHRQQLCHNRHTRKLMFGPDAKLCYSQYK